MDTAAHPSYRIISNHGIGEVRRKISNGQNAFFALRSFRPGELISKLAARSISAKPTYLTLQTGVGKHIMMEPEHLQYINHSCEPNVFFDTASMEVIALKQIMKGEEMTFFYPSTEWKMSQSFHCYCGSPRCLGEIKGAFFIPKEILEKYRLTDFIQQQLAKKTAKKVA